MKKYCYGVERDSYTGDEPTIKECKAAAKKDYPEATEIYIGEFTAYSPYINASGVIEELQQEAIQEVGDYAESWLEDVKKEDIEDLEEKLNKVLRWFLKKKEYKPSFGFVEKAKLYKL